MSNYNPYAPPQQDAAPMVVGGGGVAHWDGKLLTVPKQYTFPRVCLKCASPQVNTRRTQKFAFTPTWARMMILICTPGAAIAMLITTKRATLELPLCDPCDQRWKSARNLTIVVSLVAILAIFGAMIGLSSIESGLQALMGLAVFGIIIGLVVFLRMFQKNMLQAKKIDDTVITLVGVDANAGAQVAAAGAQYGSY